MDSLCCQVVLDQHDAVVAEVRDRWDAHVVIVNGLIIYHYRHHLFVIIKIHFLSTMILITINECIQRA